MSVEVRVQRWQGSELPTLEGLRRKMESQGLHPYSWSNAPGDVYPVHSHSYHKVIYVAQGSITFGLPASDEEIALDIGDRLDLPAGVDHNAVVGLHGVTCLEAHRSRS